MVEEAGTFAAGRAKSVDVAVDVNERRNWFVLFVFFRRRNFNEPRRLQQVQPWKDQAEDWVLLFGAAYAARVFHGQGPVRFEDTVRLQDRVSWGLVCRSIGIFCRFSISAIRRWVAPMPKLTADFGRVYVVRPQGQDFDYMDQEGGMTRMLMMFDLVLACDNFSKAHLIVDMRKAKMSHQLKANPITTKKFVGAVQVCNERPLSKDVVDSHRFFSLPASIPHSRWEHPHRQQTVLLQYEPGQDDVERENVFKGELQTAVMFLRLLFLLLVPVDRSRRRKGTAQLFRQGDPSDRVRRRRKDPRGVERRLGQGDGEQSRFLRRREEAEQRKFEGRRAAEKRSSRRRGLLQAVDARLIWPNLFFLRRFVVTFLFRWKIHNVVLIKNEYVRTIFSRRSPIALHAAATRRQCTIE